MNAKTDGRAQRRPTIALVLTSFGLTKMLRLDAAVPSLCSASQRRRRLGTGERRWTSGPPPELHHARASGDGAGLAIAARGNHHSSPPRYTSNFTPSTIGIPNARIATGINHATASN